ncbi:30S ribosomal protein S30e [Candidatus Bathyarchaeota archaeon]|nr:30S ribosomal protein S30e [Candidatus Bathyarchaeota archaeon]
MPTHGSLTKAGKVRSQTPKIQAAPRISVPPRIRFRKIHMKRFVLGRKIGQNWMAPERRRF